MNKVWFDLKEANADLESDCFDSKSFQKENITLNENVSHDKVSLPFKEYAVIIILIGRK